MTDMDTLSLPFPGTFLEVRDSSGRYTPATPNQILSEARKVLAATTPQGAPFTSPEHVADYLTLQLGDRPYEVFAAIFLDARHRFLGYAELFRGTTNSAAVYVGQLVRETLLRNATAVIVCHNHPSGEADPSTQDKVLTDRIKQALALVDVRLLDHVVVGGASFYSFANHGLI